MADEASGILAALGLSREISAHVDGGWLGFDSGRTVSVEDPSSAREIATVLAGAGGEIDQAVKAADRAYQREWSASSPSERARLLAAVAARLIAQAEHIARLESLDTGKPLSQARSDVAMAARYFSFYAAAADKTAGQTIWGARSDLAYTVREPFGVVAQIIPWNSPIAQLARGVAPALAMGNTVVIKPSEIAPLSSAAFGVLCSQVGLPRGVVNVVPGIGPVAGEALTRHPLVRQITFTGSVAAGRRVLEASAVNLVPCTLELGGKSPGLVFEDADIDVAVAAAVGAVRRNSGQSCSAMTRVLVHESIHHEVLERIVREVSKLKLGPGLDDLDLGPLASAAQRVRVESLIQTARAEGASVACGGSGITDPGLANGYFVAPTVLANVKNSSTAAQTEIFGPVQSVISFADDDEAVSLANDSDYGLCAGIFTNDFARALRIAPALQVGQVHINEYPLDSVEIPFGGYKASGIGREKGLQALEGYSQLKSVLARVKR